MKRGIPLGLVFCLSVAAGCRAPTPAEPPRASVAELDLRLKARAQQAERLRARADNTAHRNRRDINRALDDLEEFRTVAAMKLETLRAADAAHRSQAQDEAEAALADLDASLKITEEKIQ